MTKKIITWTDLQGRYRVTSPAYNDATRPAGETEDECIKRVWAKIVASGGYGIQLDHSRFLVENADQLERLGECCGEYFRYPPGKKDDKDESGNVRPEVIARYAWEMDTDGRPKVNMVKARSIQMDYIRIARDKELAAMDVPFMRAIEIGDVIEQQRISELKQILRDIPQKYDLSVFKTPKELKVAWPKELEKLDEKIKSVKKGL